LFLSLQQHKILLSLVKTGYYNEVNPEIGSNGSNDGTNENGSNGHGSSPMM
jgi:hypothetical protein